MQIFRWRECIRMRTDSNEQGSAPSQNLSQKDRFLHAILHCAYDARNKLNLRKRDLSGIRPIAPALTPLFSLACFEDELLDKARRAFEVFHRDVFIAGMVVRHAGGKGDGAHAATCEDVRIGTTA